MGGGRGGAQMIFNGKSVFLLLTASLICAAFSGPHALDFERPGAGTCAGDFKPRGSTPRARVG
eukprot:4757679-Pyramimonas_sp.AAC.1